MVGWVNLAKAVIELISHLEDARRHQASMALGPFLLNGLNYQGTLFRLFIRFLLVAPYWVTIVAYNGVE